MPGRYVHGRVRVLTRATEWLDATGQVVRDKTERAVAGAVVDGDRVGGRVVVSQTRTAAPSPGDPTPGSARARGCIGILLGG